MVPTFRTGHHQEREKEREEKIERKREGRKGRGENSLCRSPKGW